MEQPEWFVSLPGFLDKNNDLLFRNLKEVSAERRFQDRMRSWVSNEVAPEGKDSSRLYLEAACPQGCALKRQIEIPLFVIFSTFVLRFLWFLCTSSLKISLSTDHVQLRESHHKPVL